MVAGKGHEEGHDEGEGSGDLHSLGEEGDFVLAGEVPCGNAEHEEAAEHPGRGHGVEVFAPGVGVAEYGEEVVEFGAAIAHHVAHGVLHEAVGEDDPQGGDVACKGHHPDGEAVHLLAHAFPAEGPDRDERGFEEEGDSSFDSEQRAEDIAHEGGITRPVSTELEFQRDTSHNAKDKVDEEEFSPEFDHALVVFVARADIHRFHDGQQDGKAQRERHENKVEEDSHGKLKAGKEYQVHSLLL